MKRGKLGLSAIFAFVFALAMTAPGQTVKPKSNPKPPPKSAPAIAQGEEPKPLEFGDTGPSFEMPATWPAPAPRPAGSPEEAASVLAKAVFDGGAGALPAIQRAALESGLSIRNEAGGILHAAPEKAYLGLAISDFELAVAAFLTHRRDPADLKLFNRVYANNPVLASMDLASLLARSTSEFQGSTHAGKRFFGAFVRALGLRSDGDFSIVFEGIPNNTICGAQLAWLAYSGAGQAVAARSAPPDFSFRPISRGPSAFNEFTQQGSIPALQTLLNMSAHLGNNAAANQLRQSVGAGNSIEIALLELVHNDLIRAGMRLTGTMTNSPLVRTKQKGQVGGRSNLDIRLDFQLSTRDRARFASAAQQLNAQAPLPPNGPLGGRSLVGSLVGNLVHIANVPQWSSQNSPGRFRIVLEGNTQTVQYPANAFPVMFEAGMMVAAGQTGVPEGPYAQRYFKIPVRDWMEPGIYVNYSIAAGGQGANPGLNGATTEWSTHRYVKAMSTLSMRMDVATLPDSSGRLPTDLNRFISWISDPEKDTGILLDWDYEESVVRHMPPSGCAVEDGTMDMLFSKAFKRQDPTLESQAATYIKYAGFQEDLRSRTWDAQFVSGLNVPVTVTASGAAPNNSTRGLFSSIEFDPADKQTLRIHMPTNVWARPVVATPGAGAGFVQYDATFQTRAKYTLDRAGQKSIEVAGTVSILKSPNTGAPTEAQVQHLVHSLFRRLSNRN